MTCPNRYHLWAALECHAFSKAEAVLKFSAEEDGIWVQWQDYAHLKAEVERLRKAGDAMASSIQFNEEMAKDYEGPTIVRQCVKDWNAAKEGKPSV